MTTRRFLVWPFQRAYLNGRLFESPYGLLRDLFASAGVVLETSDAHDLAAVEKLLFFNYNGGLYEQCVAAGLDREQLVLFTFEPPAVIPEHGDPEIWAGFGCVFTHDDRLVDGARVRKLRYPQGQALIEQLPSYEDRRFLTLINANKYSYVRGELYGMRRRAIRYFERSEDDFEFYGRDWSRQGDTLSRLHVRQALESGKLLQLAFDWWDARQPYRAYRGSVEDKYDVLQRYRFAICFENQGDLPGYITEKIFDCLVCGTVPIYLGAPNVAEYMPPECFVDMRAFESFDALASFVRQLEPADVGTLRDAGRDYLRSARFAEWRPDAVFRSIVEAVADPPT